MASTPMPFTKPQFFTDAGAMASSYKLFTYDAGTTTKRTTYTDSALTSANANPIILDAYGRCSVYLLPQQYKFVLAPPTDSDPPIAPIWTADNIPASAVLFTNFDLAGTAGETITLNDAVYLSDGSGGATAGRWYRADADFTYASTAAYEIGFALASADTGTAVNVRQIGRMTGLSGLTTGTSYYISGTTGAITSTAPSNAIIIGKADSTTSLILDPSWGLASATARGLMSFVAQGFAGTKTFNVQPKTYIGTASTLPGTIGGVFATDVTLHSIAGGSTDVLGTDSEIPANMLNANGKAIRLLWGSTNAMTGATGHLARLDIGGTITSVGSWVPLNNFWYVMALITRLDSATVVVTSADAGNGTLQLQNQFTVGGLNFTAAIDLRTVYTTTAANTMDQTYFMAQALG